MKGILVLMAILLSAGTALSEHLFTEKNGNTFVWDQYEIEDGQYCTWLYAGRFCVPKGSIASVKKVNKREVETKKIADTKTKSYVPIYNERPSEGGSSASASSSSGSSRGAAVVRRG